VRLTSRSALVLFGIGAVGGLVGDACHVASGTTEYLDDSLPFVWKSQLWFPLAVGLATVATGELRLRLGPAPAGESGSGGAAIDRDPIRDPRGHDLTEALAAIASVIAIYALSAVLTDEDPLSATVLIWALALLVLARFGGGRPALICATAAAVLGPLAEVLVVEVELSRYSADADGLLGVAEWLPALYFAFGVVAARLAELLAARSSRRRRAADARRSA